LLQAKKCKLAPFNLAHPVEWLSDFKEKDVGLSPVLVTHQFMFRLIASDVVVYNYYDFTN